mgnify:CR=1 FL=1
MIDFISGFFSWDKSKKVEEPIDPREDIEEVKEEIKINNGRDKVSKRFSKPKVEKIKLPREEREEEDE